MGFTQGRARVVPRTSRCPTCSRDPTTCGCSSSASTPGCGPRPCRPTSRTRPTASTRRCSAPASSTEPVSPSAGMTDADRDRFRARGLGITNLVRRATARAAELRADRAARGRRAACASWCASVARAVVAILGITAYRQAFGLRAAALGRQDEPFEGAELWVVPNPSGLNAHETIATPGRGLRRPGPCRRGHPAGAPDAAPLTGDGRNFAKRDVSATVGGDCAGA